MLNKIKDAYKLAEKYEKTELEILYLTRLINWHQEKMNRVEEQRLSKSTKGLEELSAALNYMIYEEEVDIHRINKIRSQYMTCYITDQSHKHYYHLKDKRKKARKELRILKEKSENIHFDFYVLLNSLRDENYEN